MALWAAELRRFPFLLSKATTSIPWGRGVGRRPHSSSAPGGGPAELAGKSAYEVLGVSETSNFAEIKASFRRLAKETHPDVAPSSQNRSDPAAASQRFLQILAAYEILSDSQRRAHYDSYLSSQRRIVQKHPGPGSFMYMGNSSIILTKDSNVVQWLKWYRLTVDDIVTQKRIVMGSSYFDRFENELYSAIRAAYFGPLIESMDLLPDCFEAEERSAHETCELLHLVSGRDLFGTVNVAGSVQELSHSCRQMLLAFGSITHGMPQNFRQNVMDETSVPGGIADTHVKGVKKNINFSQSNVYKDLELRICGKVVAIATRHPKCKCINVPSGDSEDHIHVFLIPDESVSPGLAQAHVLLGTITGLRITGEEGSCAVYNGHGMKTHMIIKHRSLMVKHMHWYQVGEVSACECRCSRARLPPSRYWLFEPRCYMHDIGGWYVETFGRDRKGRTVPSPRQWDGFIELHEQRLHPAMYLLALGYRSLDLEDAKRRKWTVQSFLEPKLHYFRNWCKKFLKHGVF